MSSAVVLKFGGSVLETPARVAEAVRLVKENQMAGLPSVVVVSAFRGVTDHLLAAASQLNPEGDLRLRDDLLSMGERTSARLFALALQREGLPAEVVDPEMPTWPVITDEQHGDANPLLEETRRRVQEHLEPLLRAGRIPVVCGFVGKTRDGHVTTLGRGGSDTTATLLGRCLGAREVVLVKDVNGVFSGDPDVVEDAQPIATLDVEEAQILTGGGAKFLQPKALRFLGEEVRVRIVGLGDPRARGTVIDGSFPDLVVEVSKAPVVMVSLVGINAGQSQLLGTLLEAVRLAGGQLLCLTLDEKAVILYVEGGDELPRRLHDLIRSHNLGKALSVFQPLSALIVKGRQLETSHGMIQRVSQPLARRGINIYGLVTLSSSIRLFVHQDQALAARELLGEALMLPTSPTGGAA